MLYMKILIINKFLYPRGGDCICALNQGALLRLNGHEVKYFAMEYPHNLYFEESFFFPKEVSFSGSNISSKLKALTRVLNGSGVERQLVKLLNE